ncbi:AAA family ATPase [Lacibacter sp. H407]|uniref:AAA family ATPase n=1 Tax=Lacibacter sp. H407 TaxID=3133423 RepID=UPI0030BC9142
MKYYLSNSTLLTNATKKDIIVLYLNGWDDWFTYSTLYNLYYYDLTENRTHIGSIKIGQANMVTGQRSPQLPEFFENLNNEFFSVGQDVSYYETLNKYGEDFRDKVLTTLNDIAKDENLFKEALKENVTKISLLRSVSVTSVEGQFRRLAQGNAELTPYNFKYIAPKLNKAVVPGMELSFSVTPNSNPPTNIHVVIGRNGVGKTHLFNGMINSLLKENSIVSKDGRFISDEENIENLFANLVSVSFSAFDESNPIDEKKDKTKGLNYSYIGLKRAGKENEKLPPKSPTILKNEFVKSVEKCRLGAKNERWIKALEMLEADPIFNEAEVSRIAKLDLEDEFVELASDTFNKLSSGHKIILLTVTRLVETVEERSLVLLDEPEAYLHPPLLSAFIRALSDLLVKRNAVAIIGTHSPVVLQEVPKSCVWKLRRQGANAIAERLEIESFGENVGILTQEVFGLEVTDSGFHRILRNLSNNSLSFEEATNTLDNQLGLEAKAILRNLIFKKNNASD